MIFIFFLICLILLITTSSVLIRLLKKQKKNQENLTALTNESVKIKEEAENLIKNTKRNELKNKQDLEMARKIQTGLLPSKKIQFKHYQITAICKPAEKIGGDFFVLQNNINENSCATGLEKGFLKLENTIESSINFGIGDVSGHGVASALVMILAINTIEELFNNKLLPKEIMEISNKRLIEYTEGSSINFVTAFTASLDVDNHRLFYSKAGHTAPLLLHKNGEIELLETEGVFLGMFDNPVFEQKEKEFLKGDKLLLYTDGLTEAKDEHGELFGQTRLITLIQNNAWLTGENLFNKIMDEVNSYAVDGINDDLTMLLLEYN